MTEQVETRSEIIEHQLINGLKVLTKEVHAAPVASSYIWYKVGSRNERPGLTGVSHWVEHMLFKGTPKFSKEELGRFIEGNGGRWNAFTSNDYTAYYETLPADKIEAALALESDRMQNSVFDPEEVEAERTVILSEREGYENTPQFVLREEVQATAYKAHPYQWGIIGWPSDLKTMTRDDLYNYYRQCYVPNNATLVLVGDFDTPDLMKQVETHFGPLAPGESITGPSTIEPEQRGERRVTVRKEGTLAYVAIVYHIPAAGHPDFYPLEVISTVLSMGKTSRFYRAVVDKQLATSAYFYPDFSKDAGLAWTFAEAQVNVDPATLEKALLEQIDRIQNDPLTEAEWKRRSTKRRHTSSSPLIAFQIKRRRLATTKPSMIISSSIPILTIFGLSHANKFVKLPSSTSLKITAQLDIFNRFRRDTGAHPTNMLHPLCTIQDNPLFSKPKEELTDE